MTLLAGSPDIDSSSSAVNGVRFAIPDRFRVIACPLLSPITIVMKRFR